MSQDLKCLLQLWLTPTIRRQLDQRIVDSLHFHHLSPLPSSVRMEVPMKRCKACNEEFEDKFSFCPVDATPLNELAAALVGEDLTRRDFHVTVINSTALPERLV